MQSFPIDGMTCASCVRRVEKAISALPGVSRASVNLATERADVEWVDKADPQAVTGAITAAGYGVPALHMEMGISGMTCASCVSRVEKAVAAVPGVVSANVNLATERASFEVLAGTMLQDIEAAIRKAGYEPLRLTRTAEAAQTRQDAKDEELLRLKRHLVIAAIFTLPLLMAEMGSHLIPGMSHLLHQTIDRQWLYIAYFVLASIVQFGPGLRFYTKGLPALWRLSPDMNSLVILGTSAAWGYSVIATFFPSVLPAGTVNVYYEASAVIITLILLGRYLEARAKGRTGAAIARLVGLQAKPPMSSAVARWWKLHWPMWSRVTCCASALASDWQSMAW